MKNVLKKGFLILICAVLLCSLAGCAELDEMRSKHALLQDNGDIIWQDAVYKELPNSQYLNPDEDLWKAAVCLTEDDVPVLLSEFNVLAHLFSCENGTFLRAGSGLRPTYYCREDLYDQVTEELNAPFTADVMFFNYYTYDIDTSKQHRYVLTDEQFAMVEHIVTNTQPIAEYNADYRSENSFILKKGSKSLLRQYSFATVYKTGNDYFLLVQENGARCLFQVPEEYEVPFSNLAAIAFS